MCILIVEDDFLIRMILAEELQEAGYTVKEAETGEQAVELLRTIDPPLRLLVTDIHMPGEVSGIDLASHVEIHHPHVPIIYTTGRPDALMHLGKLDAQHFLIRKPYAPSEIINCIQTALAA